jgi:hypothetical protein
VRDFPAPLVCSQEPGRHPDRRGARTTKLREEVEARCPVSDNITNATPVSVELVAA